MDYVKWLLSAGVALALVVPSGVMASLAAPVEIAEPGPSFGLSLARQARVGVQVELQEGIFAYRTVGEVSLLVVEGQDSRLAVRFRGEPYVVTFSVRGEALRPEGEAPYWAFETIRRDTVDGEPAGEPQSNYFVLEQDGRVRFRTTGWYRLQMRNLRLTFTLL